MNSNEQLLRKYYECLNNHNPKGIADCYHKNAAFRDIAFDLKGKEQIFAMWDMICSPNKLDIPSDIKANIHELSTNASMGKAVVSETYTYRDNGRKVNNKIHTYFEFLDGLIYRQKDDCNAIEWAKQAFGGVSGFLAGHIGFIRRLKAMRKLQNEHPNAFQR